MASTKGKDVVVEACEIPPAATHAIAPVAFEGYHILEAEAVMVTHSFPSPNIVPSANIMTDPVLAIPTSKNGKDDKEAQLWAASNPLMEVMCVAVEVDAQGMAAGGEDVPSLVESGVAYDRSTGSTAMRLAMQRVTEEDSNNAHENQMSAGYREYGELSRAEVQRLARRHAAEEIIRVEHGSGDKEEAAQTVRIKVPPGAAPGSLLTVTLPPLGDAHRGADSFPPTVTIAVPPRSRPGDVLRIETRTALEAEVLAKMARLREEAEAKLQREEQANTYRETIGEYEYRPAAEAEEEEEEYSYKP